MVFLQSREATIPITPAFQSSCVRRIARVISPRSAICRSASSKISFSESLRFGCIRSMSQRIHPREPVLHPAADAPLPARVAILPAALSRGAIINETVISSTRD